MKVMIFLSPRTCGLLLLLLLPPLSGQVVFSRRVYRESGPSYQQIWNWNPSDNSLRQISDSPRNHFRPSCSGRRILFVSPEEWRSNAKLWSFDRNTREENIVGPVPPESGQSRPRIKGCDVSAAARTVQACAKHSGLSISRDGKQTGSLRVSNDFCPIQFLAWSPSGKWLLVGTLGADTNSTSPQSDLFVLDPVAMKLTKAASGNAADVASGSGRVFLHLSTRYGLARRRPPPAQRLGRASDGLQSGVGEDRRHNLRPHQQPATQLVRQVACLIDSCRESAFVLSRNSVPSPSPWSFCYI